MAEAEVTENEVTVHLPSCQTKQTPKALEGKLTETLGIRSEHAPLSPTKRRAVGNTQPHSYVRPPSCDLVEPNTLASISHVSS